MTKPRPHPAPSRQPGYRPQPQQPAKRKSWAARGWRVARDPWILLGVVLFLGGCVVFVLAATNGQQAAPETLTTTPARPAPSALPSPRPLPPPQPAPLRPPPPPAPATIVYEVSGDASNTTHITYAVDEKGNLAQLRGESLPWSAEVHFPHGVFGPTLSLVAQSASGGSEAITCRILWDDEVVAESSARGPYAVVTCVGPVQPPPGRS